MLFGDCPPVNHQQGLFESDRPQLCHIFGISGEILVVCRGSHGLDEGHGFRGPIRAQLGEGPGKNPHAWEMDVGDGQRGGLPAGPTRPMIGRSYTMPHTVSSELPHLLSSDND